MADEYPRILYEDALASASSVVASGEATDHPVAYAYDWKPYTHWSPASGTSHTITATWGAVRSFGAWGLYGHNVGTLGGTIQAAYYGEDSAWHNFSTLVDPADDLAIYQYLTTAVTGTRFRWTFTAAATLEVCCLAVGTELILPMGVRVGFACPRLARRKTLLPVQSRDGVFLGSSIEQESSQVAVSVEPLTEAWTRATWWPFKDACASRPFFLYWDTIDEGYPAYVSQAEFDDCPYVAHGYHRAGFTGRADLE